MSQQAIAFVTGASRGIGAATAVELARRGHHVALLARDEQRLAEVADRVRDQGAEPLVLPGDLADLQYARSCVQSTLDKWGRLDVLVNNAVWRRVETMQETELETWERTIRIALTAPAFLARWAGEAMRRQQRGVIVNVSSIRSHRVDGTCAAYVACKGGLDALTYELASLFGPQGIRVVGVCPGAIDTDSSHDLADEDTNRQLIDEFVDRTPLRRMGKPEEVATVIAALASDDASYVTGTLITVDGGHVTGDYPYRLKHQMKPDQFP